VECPDDEEMMQAIAQAGFNTVMWYDEEELDLAHKYGLKLLFMPSLHDWVIKHPANWGYYVADEPPIDDFSKFAPQVSNYHQADPNHPAYVNSTGRDSEYLHSFLETFQPQVLSFTPNYRWWQQEDYNILEAYRIAGLTAGIPLIKWIEVNANSEVLALQNAGLGHLSCTAPPPPDNAEKLRQSVYTNLCYGIKGFQWFTGGILFEFGTSRLRACGKDVVALNKELQQLGPTLINLESVEVFHTPPLPVGTRLLPQDYWVQTATPDLVLGIFKDKQDNGYIIVANRKIDSTQQVVLSFPPAVTEVAKVDKNEGTLMNLPLTRFEKDSTVELDLAPGDGELLKVQTAGGGNVYIREGPRPYPRLQRWQEEVETRKQKAAEAAEIPADEVALSPLGAEWKFATDANDIGVSENWFDSSFNDEEWAVVRSDRMLGWENQGFPDYDGLGWYRQTFDVPGELAGRKFVYLYFGAVDEEAYVYLNGQQAYEHSCASTGLIPDDIWLTPFAFDAKAYLKFGQENTIAVRVYDGGNPPVNIVRYNTKDMGGIYLRVYLIGADRELDAELIKAIVRQKAE